MARATRRPTQRKPRKSAPRPRVHKAPKKASPPRRKQASATRVRAAPTSVGVTVSRAVPRFGGGPNRITVSHRELIGRLAPTGTDWEMLERLRLNPGDGNTFPWLSTIAWSWESYDWKSLRFSYEPRCATTQVGAIQMFADYDASDASPVSEQAASSYEGFLESNPWTRSAAELNPASMRQGKGMKFVMPASGVPADADPTNYAAGSFFVYAVGTGAVTLGSLWVEYTVDLMIPTTGTGGALSLGQTAAALLLDTASVACPDFTTPGSYLCTDWSKFMPSFTDMSFEHPPGKTHNIVYNPADGTFTLPGPGIYQLEAAQTFTTAAYIAFTQRPALADLVGVASTGLMYLGDIVNATASLSQAVNAYVLGGIFAVTGATAVLRMAAPGPYTSWGFSASGPGLFRVYSRFALNFLTTYAATLPPPFPKLPYHTNIPSDSKLYPKQLAARESKLVVEQDDEDSDTILVTTSKPPAPAPTVSVASAAGSVTSVVGRSSSRPRG